MPEGLIPDEIRVAADKFEVEKASSLPEDHTLPLNVETSRKLSHSGGESTVWETLLKKGSGPEAVNELIALKQVRKEAFADQADMKQSQEFYRFLKNFPELSKFVPDTLFFKARVTADSNPQAFRLQKYIDGQTVDAMPDEELYKDPEVVAQLHELVTALIAVIKTAEKNKMLLPDLMRTPGNEPNLRVTVGRLLADPRYTNNIIVARKPNQDGMRVFLVDTVSNADERSGTTMGKIQKIVRPTMQKMGLNSWKNKLEEISQDQPESESR